MAALALVVAAALCGLLQPVPVARWGVALRLAVAPVTGRAAPKLMSGADGGECDDEDSPDPYAVLEIPRSATLSEIRRAYRRRAREVHPDAGGTVEDFDRLTRAFSALAGTKGRDRPVWDASEMRRRARERAASSWSELCTRAKSYSTGAAASGDSRVGMDERLPGWGAAAAESSERRRSRSREVECDEMAVQAFVDGEQAPAETVALSGQLDDAERKLAELTNREVLEVEVGDVEQRVTCHRARVMHLEGELGKANCQAEIWNGAAPVSRDDRIQAMERELAFLELAARLRDRLTEQHVAIYKLTRLRDELRARAGALSKHERKFQ